MSSSRKKTTTEVKTPPNICTNPVPIRLRTPSTSSMIPGNQLTRFGVVEVAHRQMDHVPLNVHPQDGDQVLGFHAQQARQHEGGDGLNDQGSSHAEQQDLEERHVRPFR